MSLVGSWPEAVAERPTESYDGYKAVLGHPTPGDTQGDLNAGLAPGTLRTMDFESAFVEMKAGGWFTRKSRTEDDPTYRITFCETEGSFTRVLDEVRKQDGFPGLDLQFEGPVFVERGSQAYVSVSPDLCVGDVLADDWQRYKGAPRRHASL
jgi:hypothetical protein